MAEPIEIGKPGWSDPTNHQALLRKAKEAEETTPEELQRLDAEINAQMEEP